MGGTGGINDRESVRTARHSLTNAVISTEVIFRNEMEKNYEWRDLPIALSFRANVVKLRNLVKNNEILRTNTRFLHSKILIRLLRKRGFSRSE